MNNERKNELKKIVNQQIQETLSNLEDLKERIRPISPDNAIGRLSRMEAINEKSVAEASFRQAEEKLKRLKQVLTTLSNDDFGTCVECDEEISWARLKAVPYSTVCINCLNDPDR